MRSGILPSAAALALLLLDGVALPPPTSTEAPSEGRYPGAYEALSYWSAQRAYPDGSLGRDAWFRAWADFHTAREAQAAQRAGGVPPWEAVGPKNTTGRMLCLAFNPQNPNTIWAGSASGGIWVTHSGGFGVQAWKYLPTGLPVLGVMSIAFHPQDSNIVYAGTGEVYNLDGAGNGAAYRSQRGTYGIGVIKSTDGGQTWTKSLDWSYDQERGVNQVRLDPRHPDTVWAATTEGLYRSTDAGANWTLALAVNQVVDVWPHAGDSDILLVTAGNFGSPGHGLYRSDDGGFSWVQIVTGVPSSFQGKALLGGAPSDPDRIYASFGHGFTTSGPNASWLCRSDDGGLTWQIVNTTDYSQWQGWFSHDVAVHPYDADLCVAIGIEVWRSADAGLSLVKEGVGGLVLGTPPVGSDEGGPDYVHADCHDVVWHPTDGDVVYVATDGGVFRSDDQGFTWRTVNGGMQTTQFYNGTSTAGWDSLFFIGGLQDNSTVTWSGNGAWTRHIGGDGSWTAAHPANPQVWYASWQGLNILRSTDAGYTWNPLSVPSSGATCFIAPYVLSPSDPAVMYAGRDVVYKSVDGGSNWFAPDPAPLDFNPALAMAVSPTDEDVVYVATAPLYTRGHVFSTTDGGLSWTDITGDLPDRYLTDLEVSPHDPQVVFVTLSGFGSSHLYRSTDGGASWENLGADLPDVPGQAIAVDPAFPGHVYYGNDLGVWSSTDAGITWEPGPTGCRTRRSSWI